MAHWIQVGVLTWLHWVPNSAIAQAKLGGAFPGTTQFCNIQVSSCQLAEFILGYYLTPVIIDIYSHQQNQIFGGKNAPCT